MSKPIEELTFTDDGMFQTVMRDPEICKELVERLLHIQIKNIEYPELEKTIAPYYTSRGIRLDVYLQDNEKVIDVELQCYPQESLGKRTRYYQSMCDMDNLMKGQDYSELKENYVLFICKTDPFKDENNQYFGLPCYSFKNICLENNDVILNDKSKKVIYNASAYELEKDERIKALLKFIYTNKPGKDDFSNHLSKIVEQLKVNEKFRREYSIMNLHDRDLIRATKKETTEENAIEHAINLLKMNLGTPEQISQAIGLPLERVLELQKEISVTV